MTATAHINSLLVQRLVVDQFPQWAHLPVRPVSRGGMDNRTFHLGDELLVRLPSSEAYAYQVKREQRWLPFLGSHLTLPIPQPMAIGLPGHGYPWHWLVNRWLPGEEASADSVANCTDFAIDIAAFLISLHEIIATGGPQTGAENFLRGASLRGYDAQVRTAVAALDGRVKRSVAFDAWDSAVATTWDRAPVWVHGDFAPSNLLMAQGRLCAVIDFGQVAVGDPACDLAIAWTFLRGEARNSFRRKLDLDAETWKRGRAWALWKALIVAAEVTSANAFDRAQCWQTIAEILVDHEHAEA